MARATSAKSATIPVSPPASSEELRELIFERYNGMSKVIQRIAKFILDEPNIVALETLTVVAERCGAPASTIVRFAQSLGFDGAGPMQRLLRDSLLIGAGGRTYGDRIRRYAKGAAPGDAVSPDTILKECVDGAAQALDHIEDHLRSEDLHAAARLIADADLIYVVAFRRAYPVAAYLSYALQRLGRRTLMIDGSAGLATVQAEGMTSRDLLLATSFTPYAPETLEVVEAAEARGCPILALTDSVVSPTARAATRCLIIREPEIREFRPLTTTMCVAQALVLTCAFASS